MPKYKIDFPIRLKGKIHTSGEVDLSEEQAKSFGNALSPIKGEAKEPGKGSNDEHLQTLVSTIKRMKAEDPEHTKDNWWTKDLRPELKAIAEIAGVKKVTGAERESALKLISEQPE